MANIGYRTFNGTTDTAAVTLGNLASTGTNPGTWMWAGRVVALTADAEIASTSTFDPLDLFMHNATQRFNFSNGPIGDNNGPGANVGVDVIVTFRLVSTGTAARWSIATNSGTGWSAFTHTNNLTYTDRTFAASGNILFSQPSNPLSCRMALFAHSSLGSQTDGDIANLSANLPAWASFPGITNLWRFDEPTITDLVGTSTQASITGTAVVAGAFPLAKAPAYARRPRGLIYR